MRQPCPLNLKITGAENHLKKPLINNIFISKQLLYLNTITANK